ncbi:KTSC domain-containing protein [Acinetobacter sp. ANC 4558]|uniref:KTSC domain-containing protein n=1 Tax=Acinetobacter sp. ANC 4558 TaxID=1977876 RepID=UPI000A33FB6D|nr:KTSC domain-containing protein [Acinetobacter sp. ANC 4558]OTG86059.1 KTSC domain-containing protein [Acinetobacter sp. ANC 4558]
MEITVAVTSFKYNSTSKYLKIFYNNGTVDLFHPVPEFIYNNLVRCSNKAVFVHKYLEYNLHFKRMSIQ